MVHHYSLDVSCVWRTISVTQFVTLVWISPVWELHNVMIKRKPPLLLNTQNSFHFNRNIHKVQNLNISQPLFWKDLAYEILKI